MGGVFMKGAGLIIVTAGLAYLAIMLYLYLNQSGMIHLPDYPSRQVNSTPTQMGLGFEAVTLITDDGVTITGWYLPAESSRATLLFFHGNAGNISHRLDSLRLFHALGLSVFIIDYRGYGNSEGTPSEAGIYQDAETAWHYLTQTRGIPASQILLFGRSLGGAVAAYLAERYPAMGLVLESTFTSVPDIAADLYPWLPARTLARIKYDTGKRLPHIEMPILIIHSPQDDIIPYSHGQKLFELAREPKSFLEINGSHNTGILDSWEDYQSGWKAFIQSCTESD